MELRKNLPTAGLVALLVACGAAYYTTRDDGSHRPPSRRAASEPLTLVDEQMLKTARQLAPLADTNDEQDQAREALRLSDHELDLAFSTALREAAAPDAQPAAVSGPQQLLAAEVAQLKTKVAASQERVAQLTKQASTDSDAADKLEFAQAQLELDQDDLDDAQQDLARSGGNRHDRLERARQRHEAAQQAMPALSKPSPIPPGATLKDQAQQWFALNNKRAALLAAEQQATANMPALESTHNGLESQASAASKNPSAGQDTASLRKLSLQKKTLAELDKRIQDIQQLATAYGSWIALVEVRQRAVLHLLLRSLLAILGIALALLLAYRFIVRAFRTHDRRKRHLVEVASEIACQLVGVIAILLLIFGPPTQVGTMLGLATAGLTVVMKDFIVGFIGWFVLMGHNGVRIGDWVEINGVGGEVIEIGVLKTVLLEMGNWSNTGHPTGRRVSLSNSYAIEGHYFNFSTVGQWLWDELSVTLPAAGDPYQTAEQIRQAVERETAVASAEAEQDWERVTHQYGITKFSAKPAVDLRPGINGLEVTVRYITRAPLRYEVKSRLFQAIVALLHAGGVVGR